MVPEISHRCGSCGASIREPAMFCPECGKPLSAATENSPNSEARPADASLSVSKPGVVNGPPDDEKDVSALSHAEKEATKSEGHERYHPVEKTRETLHRASSAARGAIEDNVKRVEKIHHVSTVMLEEASTDPSLRFVLVALGLFVVFIILLVLSKVMG